MPKYISRNDGWFDEGTEVKLIDDYRPEMNAGLFSGLHNRVEDEEVCSFDEFEVIFA